MIHISSVVFLVPALFIQWYCWILKLYICCYGLHHAVSALHSGNSQLDYPSGRCGNQAERGDCSSSSVSEGAADALICTGQLCHSTEECATPCLPPSPECHSNNPGHICAQGLWLFLSSQGSGRLQESSNACCFIFMW